MPGGLLGAIGGLLGTNSDSSPQTPQTDPNAFQYGGRAGAAGEQEQQYQQQGAAAQGRQGAQITNQYDPRDQSQVQGTLGQLGGLGDYYRNVLAGKAPSLAQAQMQAATDQAIAAQLGAAKSVGGPGAALAARNAGNAGTGMLENAAQQSMIGRIQEEQNAAAGLNTELSTQGQLGLGEQGLNAQTAYEQARLNQEQHGLNDTMTLGSEGMANQVALSQLQAQMEQQQLQSGNQLTAQGQQLGQSEFNAGQNAQMLQGIIGAVGSGLAADLHMVDPSGGPRMTLREEPGFIAARDDRTGLIGAIRPQPLTPHEHALMQRPHGAGPLVGRNVTQPGATVHDLSLGQAMAASEEHASPASRGYVPGRGYAPTHADGSILDVGPGRAQYVPAGSNVGTADRAHRVVHDMTLATPLPLRDPRTGHMYASDLPMGDEDPPELAAAMRDAVGPPNAYGAYTPAAPAGGPSSVADVLQGSDWASMLKKKPGAGASALQGFAKGMGQAGPRPGPIPGLAAAYNPAMYGGT